jgi:hypothetical protein
VGSWWDYYFSVCGKCELVREVKEEITAEPAKGEAPYFHDLHIVHEANRVSGARQPHLWPCAPWLALADKYPELALAGKVEQETAMRRWQLLYCSGRTTVMSMRAAYSMSGLDPDADKLAVLDRR